MTTMQMVHFRSVRAGMGPIALGAFIERQIRKAVIHTNTALINARRAREAAKQRGPIDDRTMRDIGLRPGEMNFAKRSGSVSEGRYHAEV